MNQITSSIINPLSISSILTYNSRDEIFSCPINSGPVGQNQGDAFLEVEKSFDNKQRWRAIRLLKYIRKEFYCSQDPETSGKDKSKFLHHWLPFMIEKGSARFPAELWNERLLEKFGYSSDCQDNIEKVRAALRKFEELGLIFVDWKTRNTAWRHEKGSEHRYASHKPLLVICTPKLLSLKIHKQKRAKAEEELDKVEKRKADKLLKKYKRDDVVKIALSFMKKLVPPSENMLWMQADEMVRAGARNRKGKVYAWSHMMTPDNRTRYVDIEAQIENYLCGGFKGITPEEKIERIDGTPPLSNRWYSEWTKIPKWIRALYRSNGEPLVELDMISLFPCIVGALYFKETGNICDLLQGDVHQAIALKLYPNLKNNSKALTKKRKIIKTPNNKFWNTKPENLNGLALKIGKHIKTYYPDLWEWRERLNSKMSVAGAERHAQLFWHCVDMEVKIVREVMRRLYKEYGILSNSCHDAIYIQEQDVAAAAVIIKETLAKYNVKTDVKRG